MPKQTDAATVEERLADLIRVHEVYIGDYRVSDEDRATIAKALMDRARWKAADITSGEPKGESKKRRV